MNKKPIILALDVSDQETALTYVDLLKEYVAVFKVGPVLFIKYGPTLIKKIKDKGAQVFLDLKLHDIPHTVARSVENAVSLDVGMLTLHASGGREMLLSAANAAQGSNTLLLAVTILTSMTAETQQEVYNANNVASKALQFAQLASNCNINGIVASPQEVTFIRKKLSDIVIVTPGIRPASYQQDDQTRIATPLQAIANGSNYLVIGRPIIQAADPVAAVKEIMNSLQS